MIIYQHQKVVIHLNLWGFVKVTEKIRTIRKSKNWTQEEMAEKLNMCVNAYAKIERGETNALNPKLGKIAQLLGVELLELISVDKTVYFANDNWSNNIIGSSPEIAFEIQKLQMQLSHKDETIEQLRNENKLLKEMIGLMKNERKVENVI
jgi:transcriptional regulator with XRE-family HTH domain